MGTLRHTALAACLLLGALSPVRGEDSPRAIIARAVKAVGGADRISLGRAMYHRFTGQFEAGGNIPMSGEMYEDGLGRKSYSMRLQLTGTSMSYRQVYDGKTAWMQSNGSTQELGKDQLQQHKEMQHVEKVTSLATLLTDRTCQLSLLPEDKIGGSPVVGIKIQAKDRSDVRLFFDKADGVLRQVEYQLSLAAVGLNQRMTMRIQFDDYREVDRNPGQDEERVLAAAKVAAEGPGLLAYLRHRTLATTTRAELTRLVRQLGDPSFRLREKAAADIVARGEVALPFLNRAVEDSDLEVSQRAKKCIQQIKVHTDPKVVTAVIRLVGLRRPAGAAAVLLDYLSSASDAGVTREVHIALYALAQHGKPDRVLLEALQGKDPIRRAAAAATLNRDGGAFLRQPGRRLYIPGLKIPLKAIYFMDGKKSMELTTTEVRFYNRLDDRIFARP
jgi:hypothetical protein